MKQTAVEWLESNLSTAFKDLTINKQLIKQAKELEKQQIIEAIDETNQKWRSQNSEVILNSRTILQR
jgi:UDP-glucose 6-dehydrogenase